ncbi:DUF4328 domain-containing protein [Paenibacillus glycinis]|uniref:DUF4328 domain-containing protein n=1 Tax=Paenibacillus glycinis TaxID=2697035 RepID=A0ABW9XY28_9BACL|nr:DUF4328 domain-containing protein [Paenibacillus glycinis]NBD27179.1 DUF4328 domain-containing protein [Paenibacillus glycinis]
MPLKSELMTFVLKILLAALVALAAADLVFSTVYMMDEELFRERLVAVYGFVDSVSAVLYIIIIVVYLIWIYRVHMDLNRLYLQYPRTPGSALACMLIPVYNLYGQPSTFRLIGSHYQRTAALRKTGQWIQGLAVPLVIIMSASNVLGRFVANADEIPGSILFASSLITFVTYSLFLALCLLVSKGLIGVQERIADEPATELTPKLIQEPPFVLKS